MKNECTRRLLKPNIYNWDAYSLFTVKKLFRQQCFTTENTVVEQQNVVHKTLMTSLVFILLT